MRKITTHYFTYMMLLLIFTVLFSTTVCATSSDTEYNDSTSVTYDDIENWDDSDYSEDFLFPSEIGFMIATIFATLFFGVLPVICIIICFIFYKRIKDTNYHMPLKIMMSGAGIVLASFIILCIYTMMHL